MFGCRLAWCLGLLLLSTPALAAWPSLATVAPGGGGGAEDAAVIVGVDQYIFVPKVPGAVTNASDWYRWLTETRKVPPSHVRLMRDNEGTREMILQALEAAASQVGKRGVLWFVFIGHGAPSQDRNQGMLVGVDAQQSAIGLFSRSLAQKEILATLGRGKQAHTVMLVDACFSGRGADGSALAKGLQPLLPVQMQETRGTTLLLAGKATEFAGPLSGLERPAFSYLVLGALRGWADRDGNGEITTSEVSRYARDAILATVKGRQQTPQLVGKGDVVLAKSAREQGPSITGVVVGPAAVAVAPTGVVRCPKGSYRVGGECVAIVHCPKGMRFETGVGCVPQQGAASVPAAGMMTGQVVPIQTALNAAKQQIGKGKRARKTVAKHLERVTVLYQGLKDPTDKRLALPLAAEAYFLTAELALETYRKLPLGPSASANGMRTLRTQLTAKSNALKAATTAYDKVALLKEPRWAVLAMIRVGLLYSEFSEAIFELPIPGGLSADQQDIYRASLEQVAAPFAHRAVTTLQGAEKAAKDASLSALASDARQHIDRMTGK